MRGENSRRGREWGRTNLFQLLSYRCEKTFQTTYFFAWELGWKELLFWLSPQKKKTCLNEIPMQQSHTQIHWRAQETSAPLKSQQQQNPVCPTPRSQIPPRWTSSYWALFWSLLNFPQLSTWTIRDVKQLVCHILTKSVFRSSFSRSGETRSWQLDREQNLRSLFLVMQLCRYYCL